MDKEKYIICNYCGEVMDYFDQNEDFSIKKTRLGFGTIYDGDKLELRLCCSCMEKIIQNCKVSPITDVGDIARGGDPYRD